jgi:cytochrome P450
MTDSYAPPASLSFTALPVADDRTTAYRLLHERGPIVQLEGGGFAVVTRREVEYVLRHPELFSSRMAFAGVGSPLPMVPIEFDPPEHTRYRRLLQPFFGPRPILALRDKVTALVAELIDGFIDSSRCDFVADMAVPLPAEVFLAFFGLPLRDRDRLIGWKQAISGPAVVNGRTTPPAEAANAGVELHAYLISHLEQRRAEPGGEGVLAELLAGPSGDQLTDSEILGMSFQFVLAGLDTVTSALGNAFAILVTRPDLRQRIVDDPEGVPDVVEELLRLDGPVFVVPRVSVEDVELGGVPIPAGSRLFVAVSAANRDPSSYEHPDDVDLHRERAHVAFGVGAHRCIGSHLARLELRAVFEEWHRWIPHYRLIAGTEPRAPWPHGLVGVGSLPLEFPPRGGTR